MTRYAFKALLLLALLSVCAARVPAQETDDELGVQIMRGELAELRGKSRVLLIVSRSWSVDIRGTLHGVLEEVFADSPRPAPRHQYAYDQIVKKLDRYTRDSGALTTVETMEEAEFVIVYKAIAEHRSFSPDEPFVFGEMFVFLKKQPESPQPVLLWRTKGNRVNPGDAAGDFLKALKAVRGER